MTEHRSEYTDRIRAVLGLGIVGVMQGTSFLGKRALTALGSPLESPEPPRTVSPPPSTVRESQIEEPEHGHPEMDEEPRTILGSRDEEEWHAEVQRSFDLAFGQGHISTEWAYGVQSRAVERDILFTDHAGAVSFDGSRIAVILPWVSLRFRADEDSEALAQLLVERVRAASDSSLRAAYIVGGVVDEEERVDLMPIVAYFGEGRDPLTLNSNAVLVPPVSLIQEDTESRDYYSLSQIEDQREVRVSYMADGLDDSYLALRTQLGAILEDLL